MHDPIAESPSAHASCVELLPWYANGSLPDAACRALEAHLETCEPCRRQLAVERRIVAVVREPATPARSPEPALAQLLRTIGTPASGAAVPAPRNAPREWLERLVAWFGDASRGGALAVGAAVVTLGIALVTWQGLRPDADPTEGFHVLGNEGTTPAAGPLDINLVLAPSVPAARRQALLDLVDGQIIGTPNSAGAIVVRLGATGSGITLAAALARLRAEPDVVLAEAVMPMAMPHVGPESPP